MTTHAIALLHAANTPARAALFSALASDDGAPEWIFVMPVGEFEAHGIGGSGKFRVPDADGLIAASLPDGRRLPIDQDHATDLSKQSGVAAPARGWIVAMQARADGIWARVEWTEAGRSMVAGREYRGFSPVFTYDEKTRRVGRILRGALTNDPALGELTALFTAETTGMDWKAKLAALLGLADTATDEEVMAALGAKLDGSAAAMAALATAVGLGKDARPEQIATAVAALAAKSGGPATGEEAPAWAQKLEQRIEALANGATMAAAEALVDGAIREGRVGVKPNRDRFIQYAQRDPEGAKAMLAGFPVMSDGGRLRPPVDEKNPVKGLTEDELRVAKLTGLTPEQFAEQKVALATRQEVR